VKVREVVAIFHGMEADLVGGAVDDSALDAAPGEPGGESERVVVPPVRLFRERRPAELGGPLNDT